VKILRFEDKKVQVSGLWKFVREENNHVLSFRDTIEHTKLNKNVSKHL